MEPDDTVGRASAMATRVGGIRRIGPFGRNLFCFIRECFYFFLRRAICGCGCWVSRRRKAVKMSVYEHSFFLSTLFFVFPCFLYRIFSEPFRPLS